MLRQFKFELFLPFEKLPMHFDKDKDIDSNFPEVQME